MKTAPPPKQRVIVTVALVIAALAASVVVARAATHAITPSEGPIGTTCSGCHTGAPGGLTLPKSVVLPPRDTSVTADTPDVLDLAGDAGRRDKSDGQRDAVSRPSDSENKGARERGESDSADRDDSDEHETVHEKTHERDRDDDDQRDREGRRDDEPDHGDGRD